MAKMFPVEGDSAIAELWFGETPWAQISLTGINVAAVADERISDVGFTVCKGARKPTGLSGRES